MKQIELSERIQRLEQDLYLFEIDNEDIPVWERIRQNTHRTIQRQNGSGQAHSNPPGAFSKYLDSLEKLLTNSVYKNPYLASQSEILFVGHPRRKHLEDGQWWDLYCDPLHEAFSLEYLHVESPRKEGHHSPTPTPRLRYLDTIKYAGLLQQKLGIKKPTLEPETKQKLESAADTIQSEFDAKVDLVAKAEAMLHRRRTQLGLYKRFLRRVSPSLVVLVVSYGSTNEILIEACKSLGIPTVELQHGVIYEHHFGYSFPGDRTKEVFPDYLLTFGDFWADNVEFPIPDDRVIPVGYPYLDQSVDQYDDVPTQDQLLFISQGTIGEQLSKFAMELEEHPAIDHEIVYKLHPGEYDRWQDEYPWLLEADFEIVDSSKPQLYRLFAESSAQIGVSSTAVYEGLAFDLETYVYEGSSVLQPLVEEGSATVVSTADELASTLGTESDSFNQDYYFTPDATQRACDTIERLAEEGTVYNPGVFDSRQ